MRLQQKFAVLFAMLGLTTGLSVVLAVWAIGFLERELAWPLQSIHEVMSGLHEMKRSVEDESSSIGFLRGSGARLEGDSSAHHSEEAQLQFAGAQVRMEAAIDRLEVLPSYLMRSGLSTAQNLRSRAERIGELGSKWFSSGASDDRAELGRELGSVHELIERLEGRILNDAALSVEHGKSLRTLVLGLVIVTSLVVVLTGLLAVFLVRRWVVAPIEVLREAAERIGQGDLTHRVEVVGSDELAVLSRDMNEMAATLGRLQDERIGRERLAAVGEMAQRIVHNLRKPLSGIRALAETTRSELPPESDLVEVQDRIMRAVDRFEEWLKDVLRASSPLELRTERAEIGPWLRSVLDAHEPEARQKNVQLDLMLEVPPGFVRFDPHHLGHAVSAVVSNAIDFSPEGGTVRVSAGSENGSWWIRVADSGPGIPEGQTEAVFRPYMTTRTAGTGIGLAIAKRVLEQHGGAIRVVSGATGVSDLGGAVLELRLGLDVANDGQAGDSIGHHPGH